ncbi:hypothetical protein [Raoultella planticola]|uniref:hypothetical protein n=1 Tax=Raoultella planticola TaxID=575 RepID=UPI0005167D1D|nr:hypothetical protein [Raoultella planticola]EHR6806280.1 hypothetical protein [Salmonella enterica]
MRQNTAAWQHDAVSAVQQDNGAKALMEVGTRNTRFTSVRHGKVTDRTVRNARELRLPASYCGSCSLVETQKWRSVCQSRLNEN